MGILLENGRIYQINKTYKQNISHICFLIRRLSVNIMQLLPVAIQFLQFHHSEFNKNTTLLV